MGKRILVIGGNAAGPSAAAKAKRTDPSAEVIMFEAGAHISTGTCELPYVLDKTIRNPSDIVFFTPESFFDEKKVEVKIKTRVEAVDKRNRSINVRDLVSGATHSLAYDRLILCTGSVPKIPSFITKKYNNVFTLKTVEDLQAVLHNININNVKRAVIIGGGYIGLETAESLKSAGMEVTIIERENLPLPAASPEIRNLLAVTIEQAGISFIGGVQNPGLIENDGSVTKVKIGSLLLETDIIILSAGFSPNTDIGIPLGLRRGASGAYITDSRLRTTDQNIFAAGDCIEVPEFISGRPLYYPLATFAHHFGHIAGENAAGGNRIVKPVVKNVAIKIFNNVYSAAGLSEGECADFRLNYDSVSAVIPNLVKVMPESSQTFGKLLFDKRDGRIFGASFLGKNEVSGYSDVISTLIYSRAKVDTLAEIFYNYTPPVSPFINLLSVLGRNAERKLKK